MLSEQVRKKYQSIFGQSPLLVYSPANIKLAGELSDMFWGVGIGININRAVVVAIAPNYAEEADVYFYNRDSSFTFQYDKEEDLPVKLYQFVHRLLQIAKKQYPELSGFNCVIGSNFDELSGLGYYPTLAVALLFSLLSTFEISPDTAEISGICQQAETDTFGMNSGILSSYVTQLAGNEQMLKVDCQKHTEQKQALKLQDKKVFIVEGNQQDLLSKNLEFKQQIVSIITKAKDQYPEFESIRDLESDNYSTFIDALPKHYAELINFFNTMNKQTADVWNLLTAGDNTRLQSIFREKNKRIAALYEIEDEPLNKLISYCTEKELCAAASICIDMLGVSAYFIVDEDKVGAFISEAYPFISEKSQQKLSINYLMPSVAAGKI